MLWITCLIQPQHRWLHIILAHYWSFLGDIVLWHMRVRKQIRIIWNLLRYSLHLLQVLNWLIGLVVFFCHYLLCYLLRKHVHSPREFVVLFFDGGKIVINCFKLDLLLIFNKLCLLCKFLLLLLFINVFLDLLFLFEVSLFLSSFGAFFFLSFWWEVDWLVLHDSRFESLDKLNFIKIIARWFTIRFSMCFLRSARFYDGFFRFSDSILKLVSFEKCHPILFGNRIRFIRHLLFLTPLYYISMALSLLHRRLRYRFSSILYLFWWNSAHCWSELWLLSDSRGTFHVLSI